MEGSRPFLSLHQVHLQIPDARRRILKPEKDELFSRVPLHDQVAHRDHGTFKNKIDHPVFPASEINLRGRLPARRPQSDCVDIRKRAPQFHTEPVRILRHTDLHRIRYGMFVMMFLVTFVAAADHHCPASAPRYAVQIGGQRRSAVVTAQIGAEAQYNDHRPVQCDRHPLQIPDRLHHIILLISRHPVGHQIIVPQILLGRF